MRISFRRLALASLLALFGLAALLLVALHVPAVQRAIVSRALQAARESAGLEIHARSIRLVPTRLAVVADEVVVTAIDHPGEPLLRAARLEVDAARALLTSRGQRLVFERVHLQEPVLTFTRNADGAWNLPLLPESDAEGPTPAFDIHDLRIDEGRVRVSDAVAGYDVVIDGLSMTTGDEGIDTRASWQASVADASLSGALTGSVDFTGQELRLRDVRIDTGKSTAQLDGVVDVDEGTLAIEASWALDARDAAAFADMPGLAGRLEGSSSVDGPLDAPRATWRMAGSGVTDGTLPPASMEGSGAVDGSRVMVETLRLRALGGQIDMAGAVGLSDDTPTALEGRLRDVRIDSLTEAYAPDVPVAGSLSGTLSAAGPGLDWLQWDASADLMLRASGAPAAAGVLALEGPVAITLASGHWAVRADVAAEDAAVVSAHLSGQLASPLEASTVDGTLRVEADDLAALLARLAPDAGAIDGQLTIDARVSGRLDAPRASWTAAGVVTPPALTPQTVEAAGQLTGDTLQVERMEVSSGPNAVQGSLTVGLSGTQPLRGVIDARLPALDMLMADAGALGWPLTGTVTATTTLSGTLADPRLSGQVAMEQVAYAGQQVDALTAQLETRGSTIGLSGIDARSGAGRLGGDVVLDVSSEHVTTDVSIDRWPVQPVPATGEADAIPIDAEISGTVRTSGPWRQPSGTAALDVARLAWDGEDVGPVSARVVADGAVATLSFEAPRLHATGSGRLPLVGAPVLELAAQVDGLTLEPLRPWLPDAFAEATAVVSGRGDTTLDLTDPTASPSGELLLTHARIDLGEAVLELEAPAAIRGSTTQVDVDLLHLRTGDLHLRVTGGLGASPSATPLSLQVDGGLAAAQPWIDALAAGAPQLSGDVSVRASVGGTLDAPEPALVLETTGLEVAVDGLPPARVAHAPVQVRDGVLTLDSLQVAWQRAEVEATMRVPLTLLEEIVPEGARQWLGDAGGTASLQARTNDVALEVLEPVLPAGALQGIGGRVAAVADLTASGLSLAAISGHLTLTEASFTLAGLPLAQARPTVLRFEAGDIIVKDVLFSGVNTDLSIDGFVDVSGDTPVADLLVRGLTDLALLRPFLPDAVPGGRAEVNLSASGTLDAPRVTGELTLTDASLRLREPRLVVEQLNGTARFTGRQMVMPALEGYANGAPVTVSAALVLGADNTPGGQVRVRGTSIPLEFPEGLRTEADVDILASVAGSRVDVTGDVEILRGLYRDPVILTALPSTLFGGAGTDVLPPAEPSAWDVRFNIDVRTREDLVVDNNYGRFSAGAALRVIGSLEQPALSGRVTLREGGELYLGGLTYRIDRGVIDFVNPARIEPVVDLAAETRVRGERIRIEATGTPDTLDVALSAPDASVPRSQADLASMLVSGFALDELSGVAAGEQALGLLSADLLGVVGRGVGLDALRLERELAVDDRLGTGESDVAAETDPVARLTLAKRLRSDVELVFSQNLRDANAITWLVTWAPIRRTEVRFLQRDDRSVSYELRREVVFGEQRGPAAEARPTPPRVRDVRLSAPDAAMQDALIRQLSVRAGRRFDFFRWQDDRDRLAAWLTARGHLEHRVTARRVVDDTPEGPVVDLHYEVDPGPVCRLEVQGAALDASTLDRMRDAWSGSVYDGFLVDDLSRLAREALLVRGYPMSDVAVTIARPGGQGESAAAGEKVATVAIETGPALTRRTMVEGLEEKLDRLFTQYLGRGGDHLAWLDPAVFRTEAAAWLRSRGALRAEVTVGDPVVDDATARRVIQVAEGDAHAIGRIVVEGVPAARVDAVRDQLGLTPDDRFDAVEVDLARREAERWYAAQGFRQATVTLAGTPREDTTLVDITAQVSEGPREVIAETRLDGVRVTHRPILDRALALPEGVAVTPAQLLEARKRLYDTGVLATADVTTEPTGPSTIGPDGTVEQPVTVVGAVREIPRLRLRFGLAVNDDVLQEEAIRATATRRVTPGLSALLENRNLFGRALNGGVAGRYERTRQLGRSFLTLPALFGRDLRLQASTGIARSRLIPDATDSPIDLRTDATFGVTQALPGLEGLRLTYGYRYERSRTYDPIDPELFDITIAAPRLTSTAFVDRRDDATDATRGWFHASTVEFSRGWLRSDFEFVRYYAQQSIYRRVGRAVLAGRTQIGLGRGFGGQNLLASERFSAGGAVSVRGYGEDVLGEVDPILGVGRGDGLVIVNGEVRMPLLRWLQGVGFVDSGGVYDRVSDVGAAGLRWGTGAGVRVSTPAGLLRVDFGVPITRRPIDDRWRVYVGLGQIF